MNDPITDHISQILNESEPSDSKRITLTLTEGTMCERSDTR